MISYEAREERDHLIYTNNQGDLYLPAYPERGHDSARVNVDNLIFYMKELNRYCEALHVSETLLTGGPYSPSSNR